MLQTLSHPFLLDDPEFTPDAGKYRFAARRKMSDKRLVVYSLK
jgi:hypothetical protein